MRIKLPTYRITLEIESCGGMPPDKWDWKRILGFDPYTEDVRVIECHVVLDKDKEPER